REAGVPQKRQTRAVLRAQNLTQFTRSVHRIVGLNAVAEDGALKAECVAFDGDKAYDGLVVSELGAQTENIVETKLILVEEQAVRAGAADARVWDAGPGRGLAAIKIEQPCRVISQHSPHPRSIFRTAE